MRENDIFTKTKNPVKPTPNIYNTNKSNSVPWLCALFYAGILSLLSETVVGLRGTETAIVHDIETCHWQRLLSRTLL